VPTVFKVDFKDQEPWALLLDEG